MAAAAEKQAAKATTQDAVLAQDIETAPAVQLASGDGDVSTTGGGSQGIVCLSVASDAEYSLRALAPSAWCLCRLPRCSTAVTDFRPVIMNTC